MNSKKQIIFPKYNLLLDKLGENIKLAGSHYEDHNYLLPVPQTEIDLNPKLTQNPGY